jgi:nicotinamide riboside kinase
MYLRIGAWSKLSVKHHFALNNYKLNIEIKCIVLTGVECSGKSTLASALSAYYKEPLVREMAREYFIGKPAYEYEDIEAIARLQWNEIVGKSYEAHSFLFIDTDFLVLKIWSEEKFGKCCQFVLDALASFKPYVYILPSFDIPYEPDLLRETPDAKERERLYRIYLAHLVEENFIQVSGINEERLKIITEWIEKES